MTDPPRSVRQLRHTRVGDCMHRGVLSCDRDAPLGEVAGMMVQHRVHVVALVDGNSQRPVGLVSDLDLVAAATSGEEASAGQAAASETLTISAAEPLDHAAQLMSEHATAHLVVVDPASGYPVGVLSTLDVAAVYAGSAAR